MRNWQTE